MTNGLPCSRPVRAAIGRAPGTALAPRKVVALLTVHMKNHHTFTFLVNSELSLKPQALYKSNR